MSIRESLIEAVKEVSQDNASSAMLVEKVLSGDVNLTPAEALEVQAVLEAAKALLASQPEAMGTIESIESALRPVIAANALETAATNAPQTSTTNATTGTQTVTFSPENSQENSVANAVFSTSRQVTSNLGLGLEAHNANILTPFVQQVVGADGNLGGSVRVSGQVGNLADQSSQQSAGNVGSGSVARLLDGVKIVDTEKPVEVAPPPTLPPIGKVFIRADQESVLEQSEGLFRTISFTVTRSDATGKASVAWKAEGIDLQDLASGGKLEGKVEFAAGQRTAKIEFVVRGDNQQEGHETLTVQLGTTEGFLDLGGGPSKASTVITNDDGIFSVTSAKDSQLEGGRDEAPELVYKVSRTDATSVSSVKWRLEGLNPKDFPNGQLPFGELQFAAGQLEAVVTIKLKGDDIVEPSLTAKIVLSDPGVNATISSSSSSAETLIKNDDSVTSVRAVRAEQFEGQPGHTPVLEYIVERTDTTVSTTIDWKLEGLNPADFGGALPTGQVFLAAGQSSATIRIFTKPDYEIEPDEIAVITLVEHGKNTTIDPEKNTASTLIRSDDQGFVIKALDAEKIEGQAGTETKATFRIIRDGDLENPASVGWQVAVFGDGVSGQSFVGGVIPSGTVQFAAHETEKIIEINLAGNDIPEPDRTYQVLLRDPSSGNRILIGAAEGKILDDDALVQVKALTPEIPEGNEGVSIARFEIIRANQIGAEQSIKWNLAAAGELPIKAADFAEGSMQGEVVFAPNQSTVVVEIPIISDSVSEGNKVFILNLQDENGNNLTLGQSQARVTILSDDAAVAIKAQATDFLEGSTPETANSHQFIIERSRNFGETFTVSWQVKGIGDTPVDAADFGGNLPSGTVTFGPQDTQKIISVTPTPDQTFEADEQFVVEISTTAVGVDVIQATARGSIFNDEANLQFTQSEWSVIEGNSGEVVLLATVERTGFTLQNGSVKWRLSPSGDHPVSLDDLIAEQDKIGDNNGFPSGTVNFEVGQSSAQIEVRIRPDSDQEPNETFSLQLFDPGVGHNLGALSQATGTVINDDSTFSISGPESVIEGQTGSGNSVTFVVTRSGNLGSTNSVNWRVVFPDGGATADDFSGPVSGTLNFATASSTQNIVLQVVGDDVVEPNESFRVELFEPSLGATVSPTQGAVVSSITNDDSLVNLVGVVTSVAEGNATNGVFTFKAVREGNLNSEITIGWEISGSGTNPANADDFVTMSGNVVIASGASEGVFTVSTVADNKFEATEGFTVSLKAPAAGSGFLLGNTTSVVGEILNDDQKITVSNAQPMQEQGDGVIVNHQFTITREGPLDAAATLNWRVEGVTASAADFPNGILPSGQVTFAANESTATVAVPVMGDGIGEGNETFKLLLSSEQAGFEIVEGGGIGTILDDDVFISINRVLETTTEGAANSSKNLQFVVSRQGELGSTITLNWTATGDTQPLAASSGTVTLAANQSSATINLTYGGNNTINETKTIGVTLDGNNITIVPEAGKVMGTVSVVKASDSMTVTDDDALYTFAANSPSSIMEKNEEDGPFETLRVNVERSGRMEGTDSIQWKVVPKGVFATNSDDFVLPQGMNGVDGFPAGTLTFNDGTAQIIEIQIKNESLIEADELFEIVLSSSSDNVSVGAAHEVTILSDDPGYVIAARNPSQNEGHIGTVDFLFDVVRGGSTQNASTVSYTVSGTGANPADAADFGGIFPSGTVHFAAGESKKTITIAVSGDTVAEQNEGFKVTLSGTGVTGALVAESIIVNDDIGLDLKPFSAVKAEGNTGTTDFVFEITRSGLIDRATTTDWQVNTGVVDSHDFASGQNLRNINSGLPSGTVSFAAGETSKQIIIKVVGDGLKEADEVFQVQLLNPGADTGYISATANGTIQNDDAEYEFAQLTSSVLEGDSGTKDIVFTVNRTGKTDQATTVNWSRTHVSTNNADFDGSSSGVLEFAAGQTSKTITLKVVGDKGPGSVEGDETFKIVLSNPSLGSSIKTGHTEAVGTIIDNDVRLKIDTNSISLFENRVADGVDTNYVYTFTREGYLGGTNSFTWTSHGESTATRVAANSDDILGGLKSSAQTITFSPNETTKTITITAKRDDVVEPDEWFRIDFANLSSFDEINGFSTKSSGGTITYHAYGEIKRDEPEFDIAGFYATKPADGLAGVGNVQLSSTTSPLEGGNGQTSSVWFRIERTISQHGEASATWKLVGAAGDSTPMISSNSPVTKNFSTAANATDFVTPDSAGGNGGLPSGVVVFADQEQYKWVEIQVNGDVTAEDLERYTLTLTASSAGSSIKLDSGNQPTQLVGNIRNDDAIYGLVPQTIFEGSDGGLQEVKIKVDRGNSTGAATIDWALTFPGGGDDLATKSTWYKAEATDFQDGQVFNGTLNFVDGDTEQFIVLQLKNDQVAETWFEYFTVTLSNLVAGAGSPVAGISTVRDTLSYAIIDDDHTDTTNAPILSLTANKTEEFEGTGAGNTVTYTITRSGNTAVPVEVAFKMSGLKTADVSFSGDSTNRNFTSEQTVVGVVNFTAGQTTKTITTTWTPNDLVESDKTITFEILTPAFMQQGSRDFSTLITGYSGSGGWADMGAARIDPNANKVTVTQKNDDVRLWISGYSGSNPSISGYEDGPLNFTITRDGYLGVEKTITYSMTDRNDFKNLTGTITLPANQASVAVSLDVFVNDTLIEAEETFTLTLTSGDASVRFAPNALSGTNRTASQAFNGKIFDDDNIYTLSIAESSKEELDNSNQTFTFTANRDPSGYRGAVTLRYQVEGTGTNPANADDFVGGTFPTGTVTIAANENSANFNVLVAGDLKAEPNETFKVTLTEVVSGKGTISTNEAHKSKTATIVTDDTGISIADVTTSEADSNQTVTVLVTRSGDLRSTSTMSWAVNHLTTSAADFTGPLSGNLSFAANESSKTITLTIAPDELVEGTESFEINLANFVGVDEFIKIKAVVTVMDNDSQFNISATEQALSEAAANFSFEITRTYATPQNQTINWAVQAHGDRTVNAADFSGTLPSGSVTFTGNELSKTITFSASNDATAEPTETFKVVLSGGAGFTGSSFTNAEGFGKIINDDQALELVMATTEFREGSQENGQITFQVLRSGSSAGTASVDWAIDLTDKTASMDDFTGATSGTIQFAAGETSKSVTVLIANDSIVEPDETFLVRLSNSVGAPITVDSVEGKILNDDANLSINSGLSVAEGQTGTTYMDFTVTRTGSLQYAGSVLWRVLASGNGSLADASDFEGGVLPTGTLEFAANAATGTIRVPILGDSLFEANESFTVELYNPSAGHSLLQSTGIGTILNDDAEFILESATNSVVEGTASGNPFVFTIKRTGVFLEATTVEWFLADSSVAKVEDFVGTVGGVVNFVANQSEATVTLQTNPDRDVEGNETFTIGLKNAQTGHSISSTAGTLTATIIDDDSDIMIQSVNGSVYEGDTSGNDLLFRVTRSGDISQALEFDWTVVHGTTSNGDFLNSVLPTGKVNFLANQAMFDIIIKTNPDYVLEADETFTVQLSNVPSQFDLVTASATGTILNDDDEIGFTTLKLEQEEGTAAGQFSIFKFTVTRSNGVGPASVDWNISGTGNRPATADDFAAVSGQVSFLDGETTKDIEIAVVSDGVAEYEETFQVALSNPSLGSALKTGASVATGKILNDDPAVYIVALDAQKSEGAAPGMGMRFEIIRTGNLQAATTVNWSVEGSGANPANIADFGGFMPSGQVAFAAGEGSKIVVVGIRGDDTPEPDETFTIRLSNVVGATVLQESVEATILNDDTGIRVKALDPELFEGSGVNTPFRFQIEALGPITTDVSATWRVKGFGVNAAGTDDFVNDVFPGGQVTLNAQNRSTIVTVEVLGDSIVGPDEEFEVILENVSGAQIMDFQAVSKIKDDDSEVGITTRELSKPEGNLGETTEFVYDVNRTGYLESSGSVEWRVVPYGVNGVDAADFSGGELPSGTIHFNSQQNTAQIQFSVAGDNQAEPVERFRVELFNPGHGISLNPEAYADGTIQNDDQELSIFAVDAVHKEGNEFSDPFTFDVYRSGKTDGSLEVTWRILPKDGVASADASDFVGPMSGSFTWAANQISHRLSFAVHPDTVAEPDERFIVEVSAANMASVQAEGTILNDDAAARLRWIQYEAEVVVQPDLATGMDLDAAGIDHGIVFSMSQIASDFSDSNSHVFTDDEIS